jgi:hypothetical protein
MAAEHPVREDHENILRTLLKLTEGPELPQHVKDAYWRIKRPADRINYQLSGGDLIQIALAAEGATPEERPYSFLDVIADHGVEFDTVIEVKWRFGKWHKGWFKGVRGTDIVVVLDDETAEERILSPDRVRLPE